MPGMLRKSAFVPRYQKFESISLQRGVSNEPSRNEEYARPGLESDIDFVDSGKSKSAWTGRGRCHDNIFVERLWWTVKHEWVYLRPARLSAPMA